MFLVETLHNSVSNLLLFIRCPTFFCVQVYLECFENTVSMFQYVFRSAGATMVEMLTQKSLWPRLNQIQWMFQLRQQQKPEYTLHPSVSQTARNLLTGIFNYKDRIRPRAEQCLGHPWFKTPEINSPGNKN